MNKTEEASERLAIALIERQILAAEETPSLYRRFMVGIQDFITAVGGRTFMATSVALFSIPAMTLIYFYLARPESYIPLLIGCVTEASILLFWIYRGKLKSITGPGGVSANFSDEEVERLTLRKDNQNKQRPGRRRRRDTAFNFDLEDNSIVEESESSLERSE